MHYLPTPEDVDITMLKMRVMQTVSTLVPVNMVFSTDFVPMPARRTRKMEIYASIYGMSDFRFQQISEVL